MRWNINTRAITPGYPAHSNGCPGVLVFILLSLISSFAIAQQPDSLRNMQLIVDKNHVTIQFTPSPLTPQTIVTVTDACGKLQFLALHKGDKDFVRQVPVQNCRPCLLRVKEGGKSEKYLIQQDQ